jgi:hypothetical protein
MIFRKEVQSLEQEAPFAVCIFFFWAGGGGGGGGEIYLVLFFRIIYSF